jgi:hypothetical protein
MFSINGQVGRYYTGSEGRRESMDIGSDCGVERDEGADRTSLVDKATLKRIQQVEVKERARRHLSARTRKYSPMGGYVEAICC